MNLEAEVLNADTEKLVDDFATALKAKLLKAQIKYGHTNTWMHGDWEEQCRDSMLQHIDKGDPLDVAAYCAFMWFHSWSTAPSTVDLSKIKVINDEIFIGKLRIYYDFTTMFWWTAIDKVDDKWHTNLQKAIKYCLEKN
ncbi:hypothetical protein QDT42_10195 [Acinetobacter baumannii]|uniref:hypothetical protein n=1 Tax=Acinetobacter baumannii TaxID=470 RepID=UPI0024496E09|nr:hypothetical protein [Acinetobacter baumannii]MDH2620914.1 hypothetical protein [Acinetobacter baumannii]